MPEVPEGVEILAPVQGRFAEILSRDALSFVRNLQRQFGQRRLELLERRSARQSELDRGGTLDFLPETREVRERDWHVEPPPHDLLDRRVEITGPVDRKMVINALNSGARGFMADFEDANSPTWMNVVGGHANLIDAIERTIEFTAPDGREYRLNDDVATLLVRPRGWHLPDKHVLVDGTPVSGSLLDFGLFFFHNAHRLLARGSGPYFYLPKLESHLEARLWNDVFLEAQQRLEVPRGTIKATVLIETLPAAFEMNEILWELREHSAGLNAGRWDYMFSIIKTFRGRPDFLLPDRNSVTMTVPFMRAYTELLVQTCHRRGAHAMGGMAAFIPSRRDAEANAQAQAKLKADKEREASDGFDGTWVAHPDSVPRATAEFDAVLGKRPNQVDRMRDDVSVGAGRAPRRPLNSRLRHRSGAPKRRERRHPVHLLLAPWERRRRHPRAHGGRCDRRDRAFAGVAVGAPRREARGRPGRYAGARPRAHGRGAGDDPRRGRERRVVLLRGQARRVARAVRASGPC